MHPPEGPAVTTFPRHTLDKLFLTYDTQYALHMHMSCDVDGVETESPREYVMTNQKTSPNIIAWPPPATQPTYIRNYIRRKNRRNQILFFLLFRSPRLTDFTRLNSEMYSDRSIECRECPIPFCLTRRKQGETRNVSRANNQVPGSPGGMRIFFPVRQSSCLGRECAARLTRQSSGSGKAPIQMDLGTDTGTSVNVA